ncbi:MAG: hypothetical protein BMS9Abin05_1777 [Rhodothermia bacterium]|nr:MAG: hypothetical protein BMS9Abin05_1777 [Rhodothermia bacterium]
MVPSEWGLVRSGLVRFGRVRWASLGLAVLAWLAMFRSTIAIVAAIGFSCAALVLYRSRKPNQRPDPSLRVLPVWRVYVAEEPRPESLPENCLFV